MQKMLFLAFAFFTILNGLAQVSHDDHPAISGYEGSEIIAFQQQDYGPYVLGIADQEEKDPKFRGHGRYFADYLDLEGKLTRIQYRVSKTEGLAKVARNYELALENAGYQLLFTVSEGESSWPFWNEEVYHQEWGINALRGPDFEKPMGREGFRYIAAKGVYQGDNIYFALFINNYDDQIFVTQDVIEINPLESGLVTAEKIEDNLRLNGFVAIYGIYFDTGEWTIKPESESALEEIAEFLKYQTESKYHIVGHTDNVGSFDSNMALSEKRANEVMNILIEEYGVSEAMLKASGVSSLSPVTSNHTDAGKARNRRVEIVEQ